jgi:hypothetical protein
MPAPYSFGSGRTIGWSQNVYDAVRIASWALLIIGALLVATGLIVYWRTPRAPTGT